MEDFDEEQIWQELELQNSAVLKDFKNMVGEAMSDDALTVLPIEEEEENIEVEEGEPDDENFDEEEAGEPSRMSKKMPEEEDYTDEDSDLDFDVDALEKQEKQKKDFGKKGSKTQPVPSEVDDKFFKLSEMESFLDDMDKQEGKEDDEEGDIDYFQDLPSDENDDLDLEKAISTKKQKKPSTVSIL